MMMGDVNVSDPAGRISRRFAPRNSVTVAIHDKETPFAYGIVTNISPSGACVVTATPLPTGSTVHLKVSFYRRPDMFEAKARVVWSREDNQQTLAQEPESQRGLLFHGMQFAEVPTAQRARLLQLLDSKDFQVVFSPKSGEFDVLMSELSEDLNRLGVKFEQVTGKSKSSRD